MTGEQMKLARKTAGISQHKLAALIGKHPMTISQYERNFKPIPLATELAVAWITFNDQESPFA